MNVEKLQLHSVADYTINASASKALPEVVRLQLCRLWVRVLPMTIIFHFTYLFVHTFSGIATVCMRCCN